MQLVPGWPEIQLSLWGQTNKTQFTAFNPLPVITVSFLKLGSEHFPRETQMSDVRL